MTHNKRRRTLREPDRTAEFMAKGYAIDVCSGLPMNNDIDRTTIRVVTNAFLAGYRAARKSQRGGG